METMLRNASDAGEDVGEPGLWIDIVELGGDDERIEIGGTFSAAVGSCEQPRLAPESDTLIKSSTNSRYLNSCCSSSPSTR